MRLIIDKFIPFDKLTDFRNIVSKYQDEYLNYHELLLVKLNEEFN